MNGGRHCHQVHLPPMQPQPSPCGAVQWQGVMPPLTFGLWHSSPPQPPRAQSLSVWQASPDDTMQGPATGVSLHAMAGQAPPIGVQMPQLGLQQYWLAAHCTLPHHEAGDGGHCVKWTMQAPATQVAVGHE
jgi:hypothetical protein